MKDNDVRLGYVTCSAIELKVLQLTAAVKQIDVRLGYVTCTI